MRLRVVRPDEEGVYRLSFDVENGGKDLIRSIFHPLYSESSLFIDIPYYDYVESSRPSLDEAMMESAHTFATRSTCSRRNVGCVITDRDRRNIRAIGYNGGARGMANQCDSLEAGSCGCLHAEINALTKNTGDVAYCTLFPCLDCAKALVNAGIEHVYYSDTYRKDDQSRALFEKAGIDVTHIDRDSYKWKIRLRDSD
jgi:dCMP deaminase